MKFRLIISFIFLSILLSCDSDSSQKNSGSNKVTGNVSEYVNPFIGTDGHGHTYPGASMPFGMVQLSPDTRLAGWDGCSGYHYSDSIVYGFSHTHLSGTGVGDYCDILLMPTVGKVNLNNGSEYRKAGYASLFSHKNETASPGYYSTFLDDYGIRVELTVTPRTGFHKYIFPENDNSNIIIDLFHRDKVIEAEMKILDETKVEGYRTSTSWAREQHVFFAAVFSKPFEKSGVATDDQVISGREARGENIKGYFSFKTKEEEDVYVKVGISSVSCEGAWKNLQSENPEWDFAEIKLNAENQWDEELSRIEIEGSSDAQKTVFYSALYHAYLVPNLFMDVDGQYRGQDQKIHQAENFDYYTVFSLWDTFRAEHPLFTLIQQDRTNDFINTMLVQSEQGGRLPVWELAANETECMIGYHAVPVITDAYIKGIRGYDAEKAFKTMKHDAELDHFGLKYYKERGYIPAHEESESVSRTLEYAYDDWCIATMAEALGKENEKEIFTERAQFYKNIFDPNSGFMRAKMNGRWFEPFDPREVNFNYTEANSWQYSFFVPHDINTLVDLMGGKENFESKLDQLFTETTETTGRNQSDITGLIGQYAHGNEPSHHMAYLYNYIGKPHKTQDYVRQIIDELYTEKPDGLCGNEDCGQMSAWYVLSAMGFYPVTPGTDTYAIGTPAFDETVIQLENGNSFKIIAEDVRSENRYIQSARLN
ncbi:MAG: GH92 family glycosyl hydrolase, partial [Bacteroidales bacterium]|nr:GH92 family glycosyl hydrolase [Bacteroidales bacterium]